MSDNRYSAARPGAARTAPARGTTPARGATPARSATSARGVSQARGTTPARRTAPARGATQRGGAAGSRQTVRQRGSLLGSADGRYTLVRVAIVAALVVYTVLVISATGARMVPFENIAQTMAGVEGLEALSAKDANALQERFDISPDGLSGWLLYGGDSVMEVRELLIVQCQDEATLDRAEARAQARLDDLLESFRNYGTNQVDLLEHGMLFRRGPYLFYGVSESVEQWESKFLACVR